MKTSKREWVEKEAKRKIRFAWNTRNVEYFLYFYKFPPHKTPKRTRLIIWIVFHCHGHNLLIDSCKHAILLIYFMMHIVWEYFNFYFACTHTNSICMQREMNISERNRSQVLFCQKKKHIKLLSKFLQLDLIIIIMENIKLLAYIQTFGIIIIINAIVVWHWTWIFSSLSLFPYNMRDTYTHRDYRIYEYNESMMRRKKLFRVVFSVVQ